jgi:hypothetical protein
VGSGAWSEGNNWAGSNGVAPINAGDTAKFDGTSTKDCSLDANISIGTLTISNGYTGTLSTNSYNLKLNADSTLDGGTLNLASATDTLEVVAGTTTWKTTKITAAEGEPGRASG